MNDILILGCEGFIGSNLIDFYLRKGWDASGIDHIDYSSKNFKYHKLLSLSDFTELLLKNKYKYIINAAGSGNVSFSVIHPFGDFESNCFETAKILDAIRVANSDSIYLHISSAAVYGNPIIVPTSEEEVLMPLSPYGYHKLISELLCKEYYEIFNIRSCVVRPFSVYGPGLKKQLFWDIYNKSIQNSRIELYGTGFESRDFIYIDDLVKAIDILLSKAEMKAECYNVATGIETSINEAVQMFIKHYSFDIEFCFNGKSKVGDPLKWKADISKLKRFGFQPSVNIDEGLGLTYSWINNYFNRTQKI